MRVKKKSANECSGASRRWSKLPRLRSLVFVACLVAALYIASYALNSFFGGYWDKPERDGHHRWNFGLSAPTAILWQPRFGYWTPYRSDFLGDFYSPLIRFDRHFIHQTRYITDEATFEWAKTSPISDWHPHFRAAIAASRAQHQ